MSRDTRSSRRDEACGESDLLYEAVRIVSITHSLAFNSGLEMVRSFEYSVLLELLKPSVYFNFEMNFLPVFLNPDFQCGFTLFDATVCIGRYWKLVMSCL